ncbi:MAG TPA: hypothetical protein VEY87_13120 [Gaiellaceae bacterium]|nr:hypothetical protein [Gaiellaceae bacterium]
MKRLLLALAAALAAVPAAPSNAAAAPCVLPSAKPLWIDYGAPEFEQVFGRPGVIVAGSGDGYPARMRARGAQTVYWDMYLNTRVGTPSAPADPSTLPAKADRLFDFAVMTVGCDTPWIVMNELFAASVPMPWTPTQARYRANVLQWARLLAARGAKPILLVSSEPFTNGEVAMWWRDLAQVSDIVLEKYFAAPSIHKAGPELGSRRMRTSMRRSASKLFAMNIPPSKVGVMLAFQTARGTGGREGLQPASAWFEVAKLQALAARQVSHELGLAHVWSWGWGVFNEAGKDPDKAGAACVWLWTRDPKLCDAPKQYRFDADRRAGQIDLPATVRCVYGASSIRTKEIGELARVTRDAELALSALFGRVVEAHQAPISAGAVLAAERAVVAARFGGSRTAYLAALRRSRATVAVGRAVLGDELRRREIQRRLSVRAPAVPHLAEFQQTYGGVLAREVAVTPTPSWLPGGRGLALGVDAPRRVFALAPGVTETVRTLEGVFRVRALGETTPLAGIPFGTARPAIARALRDSARGDAYHDRTARRQHSALDRLRCIRDRLPAVGAVELTSFLPFLSLDER